MSKRRTRGEGTIFQRPGGLWVAKIRLPDGRRLERSSMRQSEVRDWLIAQRQALAQGTLALDQNATVGEFLNHWYNDIAAHSLRPATLVSHRSILDRHILPALGQIKLSRLTPVHLATLLADKQKAGYSRRTVRYIHTLLHQALDRAVKWGLVARNIADAVDSPAPDSHTVAPLTPEQVGKLLGEVRGGRLFAFYMLAVTTGMRRGELLGLKVEDVDLGQGLLHVRRTLGWLHGRGVVSGEPKTNAGRRMIALPRMACEALAEHLEHHPGGWLFQTRNGTPMMPRNVVRHFKAALKRAGLPESTRLHDLRHTFVTFLIAQGVHPKSIQEIIGHASIKTTMDIYGHLLPGQKREVADQLDTFLKQRGVDHSTQPPPNTLPAG